MTIKKARQKDFCCEHLISCCCQPCYLALVASWTQENTLGIIQMSNHSEIPVCSGQPRSRALKISPHATCDFSVSCQLDLQVQTFVSTAIFQRKGGTAINVYAWRLCVHRGFMQQISSGGVLDSSLYCSHLFDRQKNYLP